MEDADIVIIGAGVVGLAIASEISDKGKNIIVVEKHESFGQETSSRNSEVIHTAIYYPNGSLKAKLCAEGNELIYKICKEKNINHKKTGALIVMTESKDMAELENLYKKGIANGVADLKILLKEEIKNIEPNINAYAALCSPNTGIFDTHSFMKYLEAKAKDNGVTFTYLCEVTDIKKNGAGFSVIIKDSYNNKIKFLAKIVINCAGLNSDKIAEVAGIDIDNAGYKLHYCKGEYFSVSHKKALFLKHLIYPLPTKISKGIHAEIDLAGELKLGPNAFYVNKINYEVDENHKDEFYSGIKDILPFINKEDLSPALAGIRPKLQTQGEPMKDFVIKHEEDKGLTGFINLIGIESPGLTAAPAIARYVKAIVSKLL